MSTTLPRLDPATSAERARWGPWARGARALVHRDLARLQQGSLRVVDALGENDYGDRGGPRAELRILDPRCYGRFVRGGSTAAAQAYIDGWWNADDLTALVRVFVRNISLSDRMESPLARLAMQLARLGHWLRRNTPRGSRRNIAAHYDLGNELFSLFLDPTLSYSCAVFEREDMTLEEAQIAKLDRICRKLDLRPGETLVEIGTGWGGLALHAARRYGVRVVTTTISREQAELAALRVREAGLDSRIEVRRQDYRALRGSFDKLVSIEMIEAVGHRFYPAYFASLQRLLKPEGLALIQAITIRDDRYELARRNVDFIQRAIFPGSCIPSISALLSAAAKASDLRLVHLEDLTPHYVRTLELWRERLLARADEAAALGFGPEFLRAWEYYFCYCAGGFAERNISDVHLLLARPRNERACLLQPLETLAPSEAERR
ncbi:MAG: class I SAM-dependent methyltransferase [Planctomycetes bacterium]|nr:class I SAM-dependent methyltransferase [Planctomycetota bacterium]